MSCGECDSGQANIVRPRIKGIGAVSDVDHEEEVERGARATKKMNDPKKPSREEVEEHAKTHLPFRSWCRHCVRGRGKEMAHYRTDETSGLREMHVDFFFMGREHEPGKTVPTVAVKERKPKMMIATVVPRKSTWGILGEEDHGVLEGDWVRVR